MGKERGQHIKWQHSISSEHAVYECHTKESGHSSIRPGIPDGNHQGLVLLLLSCVILYKVGFGASSTCCIKWAPECCAPQRAISRIRRKSRGEGESPRHSSWHTDAHREVQLLLWCLYTHGGVAKGGGGEENRRKAGIIPVT